MGCDAMGWDGGASRFSSRRRRLSDSSLGDRPANRVAAAAINSCERSAGASDQIQFDPIRLGRSMRATQCNAVAGQCSTAQPLTVLCVLYSYVSKLTFCMQEYRCRCPFRRERSNTQSLTHLLTHSLTREQPLYTCVHVMCII